MKIITDAAANLTPERANELGVDVIPFQVTFNGMTYRDGIDITPAELYQLYIQFPHEYPSTSQPSVGDYISVFQKYPDEEIFAVVLSSGLSGSYNSAVQAAASLTGQKITVMDSLMVGPALGWMVEAAAHCAQKGWIAEQIIERITHIRKNTLTMVAFSDMKYLLHSGRVSHMRSLIASVMRIKPIIGMNPINGSYDNAGIEMTMGRVTRKMAGIVRERFGSQKLRMQLMHGSNLPGVDLLKQAVNEMLDTVEEALIPVTLVLGAHAGPTVIGLAAAPMSVFNEA